MEVRGEFVCLRVGAVEMVNERVKEGGGGEGRRREGRRVIGGRD